MRDQWWYYPIKAAVYLEGGIWLRHIKTAEFLTIQNACVV